jgi:hypothetical protein
MGRRRYKNNRLRMKLRDWVTGLGQTSEFRGETEPSHSSLQAVTRYPCSRRPGGVVGASDVGVAGGQTGYDASGLDRRKRETRNNSNGCIVGELDAMGARGRGGRW